jgi:hypothetical protein
MTGATEMKAGDLFYIGPGRDSWVVGDQPYISLISWRQHYAERRVENPPDPSRN